MRTPVVVVRDCGLVRGFRFCAAAAALAAVCGAAHGQLSVGPNVNISRQSGNQAEGAITINPTNPQNVFALYNNLAAGNGMYGAVSFDGGITWAARPVGTGSDGLSASDGDPTVAFDDFGNLFLCHLTSSGFGAQVGLSTNGGVSFVSLGAPVTSADQPTIIAGAGTVWMTATQGGGLRATGATVSGLGIVGAFTPSVLVPSSNSGISGDFGDVAIGPVGQVAVVYQNANSGQGPDSIFFNLDPDGIVGAGFGPRSIATATNVGGFDTIPAQPNRTVDSESGLAYDRTGGPHRGRLYLIYTDESPNESNNMDILFRYSDNNGTTWSAAQRVNDDSTTRSQFMPKIALDPVTGHLAVVWYDARNSASNNTVQVWGSASVDGGATWMPNVQISQGISSAGAGGGFDFGDFIGLSVYNDVFMPTWADDSNSTGNNPNGTGAMDMYTARVTIMTAAPCYPNCDLSTTAPILNVNDFVCFQNRFAAGDTYANCDGSTTVPILNVNDFVCFQNRFAAGCP